MGGHPRAPRSRRAPLFLAAGAAVALIPSMLHAAATPTGTAATTGAATAAPSSAATATAALAAATSPPTAPGHSSPTALHHAKSGLPITFNPNLMLPASLGLAEPSVVTRSDGTALVAAPAGGSAGCRLFAVSHDGNTGRYLDSPDRDLGGGDCDMAVGPRQSGGRGDHVSFSSALIVNFTTSASDDGGLSFGPPDSWSQQIPLQDRAWSAIDPQSNAAGKDDVFMLYHDLEVYDIEFAISVDGGQTFVQSTPVINPADVPAGQWSLACPAVTCEAANTGTAGNTQGNLVARRAGGRLTLYTTFVTPDSTADNVQQGNAGTFNYNRVYEAVGTVVDAPVPVVTWHDYEVWHGPVGANYGNIFPTTAVDGSGRVYTAWTDGVHVDVKSDVTGTGWDATAPPTPVDVAAGLYPATENTATFAWLAGGPKGADLVWYSGSNGSTSPGNPNDPGNAWTVYLAQSLDSDAQWQVARVSDHVTHRGGICGGGDACNPFICATLLTGGCPQTGNRTMLDFFQVSVDPTDGAADVAWTDDHDEPGIPALFFSRQCTGASLTTGKALRDDCLPPQQRADGAGTSCPGPQVVDTDPGDAIDGQPGSVGANMPSLELTAASYHTAKAADGTALLRVTMTVQDLEPIPVSPDVSNAWWTVYWNFAGKTWYAQATEVAGTSSASRFEFSDGSYSAPFSYHQSHGGVTGGLTGTVTAGRPGTISIDVPLADFGATSGAVVTGTYADTRQPGAVIGAANTIDRAPDSGHGASYFVGGAC